MDINREMNWLRKTGSLGFIRLALPRLGNFLATWILNLELFIKQLIFQQCTMKKLLLIGKGSFLGGGWKGKIWVSLSLPPICILGRSFTVMASRFLHLQNKMAAEVFPLVSHGSGDSKIEMAGKLGQFSSAQEC